MDPISTLQKLEPIIKEAGQMACRMQGTAKHHDKLNTGMSMVDIVTEADIAVQEFLLEAFSKTELINCRLLAEEDTPSVENFNYNGEYYLTIDPIDGTAVYAGGGKEFSQIISLHDGKNLLYTFNHFPLYGRTVRIFGNECQIEGPDPSPELDASFKNKILHYSGEPEKDIPELFKKLKEEGKEFFDTSKQNTGTTSSFIAGKIAGVYSKNPNVYDGLVSLHFAKAKGYKVYSGSEDGEFSLSNIQKGKYGLYYPGYYLALQP